MFKLLNNLEMFSSINLYDSSAPAAPTVQCECPYNNCICPIIDIKATSNHSKIIKKIIGFIILVASISMAIYRIKTHADLHNGNYESEEYILGVIVISFCCNMCYLPYAIVYSFVFNKF